MKSARLMFLLFQESTFSFQYLQYNNLKFQYEMNFWNSSSMFPLCAETATRGVP